MTLLTNSSSKTKDSLTGVTDLMYALHLVNLASKKFLVRHKLLWKWSCRSVCCSSCCCVPWSSRIWCEILLLLQRSALLHQREIDAAGPDCSVLISCTSREWDFYRKDIQSLRQYKIHSLILNRNLFFFWTSVCAELAKCQEKNRRLLILSFIEHLVADLWLLY